MQAPSGKQFSGKFPLMSLLLKLGKKEMSATAIFSTECPEGKSTTVYSAIFLEEIIAGIFLHLSISVPGKHVNISKAQLDDIIILGVNSVVNEFNNAQVTVYEMWKKGNIFLHSIKQPLVRLLTQWIVKFHCKLLWASFITYSNLNSRTDY